MKPKKPNGRASKQAAAKATSSPKRKTRRKPSTALNRQAEKERREDEDERMSDFMKKCKTAESEQQVRRTHELISQLKIREVCLYPGNTRTQNFGVAEFTGCLSCLGDCHFLVFGEPLQDKEIVRLLVPNRLGWSDDTQGVRIVEVNPQRIDDPDLIHDASLFPDIEVEWVSPEARPQPNQFWGHYSILGLEIHGERRTVHLLHLGLGHEALWLHFLQPHGIHVARIIANPPY